MFVGSDENACPQALRSWAAMIDHENDSNRVQPRLVCASLIDSCLHVGGPLYQDKISDFMLGSGWGLGKTVSPALGSRRNKLLGSVKLRLSC
jgi:hypothetical protein